MQDLMQPLIHKAQIHDLKVHIGKSGLCIGDKAELFLREDGRVAVFADRLSTWFGFLQRRKSVQIGSLGPTASKILAKVLRDSSRTRVRIVGLTPEHLTGTGVAEVHISVWGNADPQLTFSRPTARSAAE